MEACDDDPGSWLLTGVLLAYLLSLFSESVAMGSSSGAKEDSLGVGLYRTVMYVYTICSVLFDRKLSQ